jgi:hypothetical protein
MTAPLFTLGCPNCGGMLEMTSRADLFKCAHCRHLAILRWPEVASVAPDIRKLVERETWKANLLRPGASLNWQGGALLLTDDELAFVPHSLNFGPIERAILPLRSIDRVELQTGLVSDELTLIDERGERWGVRVFRGKVVRDAIEKARARRS